MIGYDFYNNDNNDMYYESPITNKSWDKSDNTRDGYMLRNHGGLGIPGYKGKDSDASVWFNRISRQFNSKHKDDDEYQIYSSSIPTSDIKRLYRVYGKSDKMSKELESKLMRLANQDLERRDRYRNKTYDSRLKKRKKGDGAAIPEEVRRKFHNPVHWNQYYVPSDNFGEHKTKSGRH